MLVVAVPVVAFNDMYAHLIGYPLPEAEWVRPVSPVLGTVMYFWGGRPFLTDGIEEIRSRKPGMMLLIALASTVAFLASWGREPALAGPRAQLLVGTRPAGGHHAAGPLERNALPGPDHLCPGLPGCAPSRRGREDRRLRRESRSRRPRGGRVVVVRPGSSVPGDGRIVDGSASMDESMVTGESKTVRRETGGHVVAGTIATDSGLRLEVTTTGEDTALAVLGRDVGDGLGLVMGEASRLSGDV